MLKSPTGQEEFDRITEVSDRLGLESRKTPDGFTALVTVSLVLLGLTLEPAQSLRLDLGYIFGKQTGGQALARACWGNDSFTANVTNDIPHESRLEPKQWSNAVVE